MQTFTVPFYVNEKTFPLRSQTLFFVGRFLFNQNLASSCTTSNGAIIPWQNFEKKENFRLKNGWTVQQTLLYKILPATTKNPIIESRKMLYKTMGTQMLSAVYSLCALPLHPPIPLPLSAGVGDGWGLSLRLNFLKGGYLTGSQFLEGACWERKG